MRTTLTPNATPVWRLQDAKAQFSALVENALRGVPQHVTRRGKQAVVVLSEHDFEAMQRSTASRLVKSASLIDHLLAMPKESITSAAPDAAEVPRAPAADVPPLDLQPRVIDFS